jgi:hypothetical protein
VMLSEFQNLSRERIRSKRELSCMQDKGGERAVEMDFSFSFLLLQQNRTNKYRF